MRACAIFKSIKSAMPSYALKCLSILAKTTVICAIVLSSAISPISCAMDDGEVKIIQNNYDSPKLESVLVTGARTVEMTFSKSVSPIRTYFCTYEDEIIDEAESSGGGDILTVTSGNDLAIGKKYILGGKVLDGGGNTLSFLVPLLGYNSHPAGASICAVHPKCEKDSKAQNYKDEFIQLYITQSGNLSGFTLKSGKMGAAELVLPAVEVAEGETVTVHLQALEDGCQDETGDNTSLSSSRYSSRLRDIYAYAIDLTKGDSPDAWSKNTATNCLSESDDVILLCNGGKVLDAVMYAAADTQEWSSGTSYDLSSKAAEAGFWNSAEPSDCAVIDKAFTAAWILKRTGHLKGGKQSGSDWKKIDFSKKNEQNVLLSLGTVTPSDPSKEGGEDGDDSSSSSSSGGSGSGGGGSSGSSSSSGSSGGSSGNTGFRPAIPLPNPSCTGSAPRVIISSVHPAYTSGKDSYGDKVYKTEFIQLYALTDGNLSHLTISTGKLGCANFYPLPAAPIKAGDIITVHLRRVGLGCIDETDEKELFLANAWYTSESLRDVWIDNVYDPSSKKGAPALDRNEDVVAVFSGRGKEMMDAVPYSVQGTTEWKSNDAKAIALAAVSAGIWPSASPLSGIQVDKAFTPATILQRNGCRELLSRSKDGNLPSVIRGTADWRKRPFGKADEEYLLQFID